MGVLGMLAASCGASDEPSSANNVSGATSVAVDSLPGQTDTGGGTGVRPTTTLVHGQGANLGVGDDVESDVGNAPPRAEEDGPTLTGAAVLSLKGFSDFFGQRVGLIASRASVVDGESTIDVLASSDEVDLVAVFAPEHGIRAEAGAGELIDDGVDEVTGLPVFSLYGSTRQPTPEMLSGVDVLMFDLQDVGTRFYTYTATMGLAMQAASAADIPFVVLDRPNPLGGDLVDGDLRDPDQESFVSQYPIPAVHGMTAGELATAIKGEGWLDGLETLDLRVVDLSGWSRSTRWDGTGLTWVPPSPGLPTSAAAATYPALVVFEATTLSFGRGTDHPFGQVGAPWLDAEAVAVDLNGRSLPGVQFEVVTFTPMASAAATGPQFEGQDVPGVRVVITDPARARPSAIGVHLLEAIMTNAAAVDPAVEVIDRGDFLDLLTGSAEVRQGLQSGRSAASIVESWTTELDTFVALRAKYLRY